MLRVVALRSRLAGSGHRYLPGAAVRTFSNYVVLGDEEKIKDIVGSDGNKVLYFTARYCMFFEFLKFYWDP